VFEDERIVEVFPALLAAAEAAVGWFAPGCGFCALGSAAPVVVTHVADCPTPKLEAAIESARARGEETGG
jgi:hypothetical protein